MDETFHVEHEYDPENSGSYKFGLSPAYDGTGLEHIVIKVSPILRDYFKNIDWHHTQNINNEKDGSLIFEMDAYINDELLGWILSWKENIKVLEPKVLIDLMLKKIKNIETLYLNRQNMSI